MSSSRQTSQFSYLSRVVAVTANRRPPSDTFGTERTSPLSSQSPLSTSLLLKFLHAMERKSQPAQQSTGSSPLRHLVATTAASHHVLVAQPATPHQRLQFFQNVLGGCSDDVKQVSYVGYAKFALVVPEVDGTITVDTKYFEKLFPRALADHLRRRPHRILTTKQTALWGFNDLAFAEKKGNGGQADDMQIRRVALASGTTSPNTGNKNDFLIGGVRDVFYGSARGPGGGMSVNANGLDQVWFPIYFHSLGVESRSCLQKKLRFEAVDSVVVEETCVDAALDKAFDWFLKNRGRVLTLKASSV